MTMFLPTLQALRFRAKFMVHEEVCMRRYGTRKLQGEILWPETNIYTKIIPERGTNPYGNFTPLYSRGILTSKNIQN